MTATATTGRAQPAQRRAGDRVMVGLCLLAAVAAPAGAQERSGLALPLAVPSQAMALRGIVKSLNQAAYSTELAAPVAEVHRREGETFAQGQRLVTFDCGRQQRELDALVAVERETRVAVTANDYLGQRGAASRNDLETAQARHDRARAEVAAMRQRLRSCEIVAPFAGAVVEVLINAHELPVPNKPFLVIAAHRNVEVEIIVPSRMLPTLVAGHAFEFAIDETRRTYAARIDRVAGVVDAMSQMVKIYARLGSHDDTVLPGMSGTASFAIPADR